MQSRIKEIHKELGMTSIFVTHDQDEAMTMADTIHGSGIFMEELQAYLKEFRIHIPFIGVDENNVFSLMDKIRAFLDKK